MADTQEELHRFAFGLGLQMLSYQGPPKTSAPHYDITGLERDRALRMGALAVSRREIVALFRSQRVPRSQLADRSSVIVPPLPQRRSSSR
jgi:hypothetical protein